MTKQDELNQIIAITSHFHTDNLREGPINLGLFAAVDLVIAASKAFYKRYEKRLRNSKTDWLQQAEKYDFQKCSSYDDLICEWTKNWINTKLEYGKL